MQTNDNLKITKAKLYPVSPLDALDNYKRVYRINHDGTILERVHLDIAEPSYREVLIFQHYLSFMVKHFECERVGIKVNSRDKPWDFNISLSAGRKLHIELTAISDNPQHFKNNKSEERLLKWKHEKLIPFYELEKLAYLFPDEKLELALEKLKAKGVEKNDLVKNLFYAKKTIPISRMPLPQESLSDILKEAINKKEEKKHDEKSKTVLIIDNRTAAFDLPDFLTSVSELSDFFKKTSFMEIWIYTGYASSLDGRNAEYSFIPIKCTQKQKYVLEKLARKSKEGMYVWSPNASPK